MSQGYVKRLLSADDTLNVLRELPIRAGAHLGARLDGKTRNTPAGVQNYEHVPAADRVSYFDLRVELQPSRQLMLHIETVQTSTRYKSGLVFKTWKSLYPCYYLPWRRNGTTRMKLSPPEGYNGDAIKFFATAAIDGCSVYVEGPAATPKVSHLNASNIAPAPAMGVAETDLAKQARIDLKIANMDARMALIRKGETRVVERQHYIEDFQPGRVAAVRTIARLMNIPSAQVRDYQPFGTVVGVVKAGTWVFYLQKCAAFEYRLTSTSPWRAGVRVLSAAEFWPTNTGGGFRVF